MTATLPGGVGRPRSSCTQFIWGTADELRFLNQLADRGAGNPKPLLARYARTLDLRHSWQNIDPWALHVALKRFGIDWTPPLNVTPPRRWTGR